MPAGAGAVSIPFDVPPYRLSGTVYGALLNHRSALDALGAAAAQPPYLAAPRAPVLCLKPRNTLAGPDAVVGIPLGVDELEAGAGVGLVIARPACNVPESRALEYVAGCLLLVDVSIPIASHHRPGVRQRARDGFCPLGAVAAAAGLNLEALTVHVFVDGILVQTSSTADLIRPAARLLADVTEFMTLAAGDVLGLGAAAPAPRIRPGQRLTLQAAGLPSLSVTFAREAQ